MQRWMMNSFAVVAVASLMSTIAVSHSDARERGSAKWRKAPVERSYEKRRTYRRAETMEDIRANNDDPACNYCGYPSWARSALSPKDGGGSGGRN